MINGSYDGRQQADRTADRRKFVPYPFLGLVPRGQQGSSRGKVATVSHPRHSNIDSNNCRYMP
jgi:hypothetical protein